MKRILCSAFILSLLLAYTNLWAADSAVILVYHRFGDERFPSTNIRLDQFEQQLQVLKEGGYHVLPLSEIALRLKKGDALPERTVGISVDDAYTTFYTEGWPRLKKAGFPVTLFVGTDPVDREFKNMMTWKQIKEVAEQGVTIGNHTAAHNYLERLSRADAKADINKGQQRLIKMLGFAPKLFAYPYGEYDAEVVGIVKSMGYNAAFSQLSGPVGSHSNLFLLTRFPLNENYGGIERFKMILQTVPLSIGDRSPSDTLLAKNNPPTIQFTVLNKDLNLTRLTCYATDIGALKVKLLTKQRVEVTSPKAFNEGRTHINCTMPAKGDSWYWTSLLYIV